VEVVPQRKTRVPSLVVLAARLVHLVLPTPLVVEHLVQAELQMEELVAMLQPTQAVAVVAVVVRIAELLAVGVVVAADSAG
jgi:hypothetical protein